MIPRYSRQQVKKIWSLEHKFSLWLEIECLVAEKLSINGVIPKKAAKEIRENAYHYAHKNHSYKMRVNTFLRYIS